MHPSNLNLLESQLKKSGRQSAAAVLTETPPASWEGGCLQKRWQKRMRKVSDCCHKGLHLIQGCPSNCMSRLTQLYFPRSWWWGLPGPVTQRRIIFSLFQKHLCGLLRSWVRHPPSTRCCKELNPGTDKRISPVIVHGCLGRRWSVFTGGLVGYGLG